MRFKRLELVGFKSFAQKTVLDFPAGTVAIVGPNGSGKSNIIDAIRWILGEREAKNLRGAKADDLIFAGTPQKPRMGMAQVNLIFDNSSGFFPVDFSEVSIVRRIDRDSASQYLLNNAEVRLKDIIGFFAQSRLGTKGFTIVNQGDSDLFVRSLPEERRAMMEEILGLRQYQLKKQEADRKLKNTNINMEKVRAMIEEIVPHLRFLKRQTSKWEKLADLEQELKKYENVYFGSKFKEIQLGLQKFDPEVQRLGMEISQKEKESQGFKAALEKIENSQPKQKVQITELRQRRDQLLQERSNIEREAGKLEAKIEFLHSMAASQKVDLQAGELLALLGEVKTAIQNLLNENSLEKVRQDLGLLLAKVVSVTDVTFRQKQEVGGLKLAKDDLLAKIQPLSDELAQLASAEEDSAKELEHFNKEFRQAFENFERKKDEITKLENEKNRFLFEIERLNTRKQDLGVQATQTGRRIEEFMVLTEPMEILDVAFPEVERRMFKLRADIAAIGNVDQALLKEAQETESRHNFLASQISDLEKATNDLQGLIVELDEKISTDFSAAMKSINDEFDKFFKLMFGGGRARLKLEKVVAKADNQEHEAGAEAEIDPEEQKNLAAGIEIELSLPRKKINGLDMLSGGEKSLVSIAALFALISVSPPPFLVLDEIDAALDEQNTKRFASLIKNFSKQTQFIIVTHNRATMEAADVLYGVTMEEGGVSKLLSLKLE